MINFCDTLRADCNAQPENYWINTSSNDSVRRFIENSDSNATTKREIERLVSGETILKEIQQELTYKDMYSSVEDIWSVLYTTGYLTQKGEREGNLIALAIPNAEIRNIFTTQIMEFFKENVQKDGDTLKKFCESLKSGDAESVEEYLKLYLRKTISIRDTFVKNQLKENFYHGILLRILGVKENWVVTSNRESGEGYTDIVIETEDSNEGIIIEIKYAYDGNLERGCAAALKQIEDTHYEDELKDEGIDKILKYGIAFYKKQCKVKIKDSR